MGKKHPAGDPVAARDLADAFRGQPHLVGHVGERRMIRCEQALNDPDVPEQIARWPAHPGPARSAVVYCFQWIWHMRPRPSGRLR